MTGWALDESGRLSGTVTFDNLVAVREAGEALIGGAGAETVEFDCSGLEEANGVAVALLIAWRRMAGASGRAVVFRGASVDLRNIAAFSGLNDVLTLEA